MVRSLILLKELAEFRRMKKLSNCYQGSAPRDESSFQELSQNNFNDAIREPS